MAEQPFVSIFCTAPLMVIAVIASTLAKQQGYVVLEGPMASKFGHGILPESGKTTL